MAVARGGTYQPGRVPAAVAHSLELLDRLDVAAALLGWPDAIELGRTRALDELLQSPSAWVAARGWLAALVDDALAAGSASTLARLDSLDGSELRVTAAPVDADGIVLLRVSRPEPATDDPASTGATIAALLRSPSTTPTADGRGGRGGDDDVGVDLGQALRGLLDDPRLAIAVVDLGGIVRGWSAGAERLFGYAADAVVGRTLAEATRDEPCRFLELRERLAAGEDRILRRARRRRPDGTNVVVDQTVTAIHGADGVVRAMLLVGVDATDGERAQAALRESESRLQRIVDEAPIGIAFADRTLALTHVNPAFCEIVRRDPENVLGATAAIYTAATDWDAERPLMEQLVEGRARAYRVEKRYVRPDGEERDVIVNVYAASADGGAPQTIVAMVEDVTERRRLMDRLAQGERLEALGRLAGGIAHDFNNLLTAIIGYASFLADDLDEGSQQHRDALRIERVVERARRLVAQLVTFGRATVLDAQEVQIDTLVAGLGELLSRPMGEDVELVVDLGAGSSAVRGDPAQLEQVVVNLLVNAREAMPGGGRMTLETRIVELDEHGAARYVDVPAGTYVRLAVSDTGIGMDERTQERVFEPFFTTKETGTGLGLSTVYGVARGCGGTVALESAPGRGTTVEVLLPLAHTTAAIEAVPVATRGAAGDGETILLVEDETIVRDMAARALRSAGYAVLSAASAGEALDLLPTVDAEIGVLVSDVIMSGMNGRDLAVEVAREHPDICVLLVSGYSGEVTELPSGVGRAIDFLPKPFPPGELTRRVRALLDG